MLVDVVVIGWLSVKLIMGLSGTGVMVECSL